MRLLSVVVVASTLVAAQGALSRVLGLSVARPDVQVAVILFLAVRHPTLSAAAGSFAVGWVVDLVSGEPTGLHVCAAMTAFVVSRLAAPFFEARSAASFATVAALVDVAYNLAAWVLLLLTSPAAVSRVAMLKALAPSALLTALAALPILAGLRALDATFKKPETGLLP